jgi:hypothetical protein
MEQSCEDRIACETAKMETQFARMNQETMEMSARLMCFTNKLENMGVDPGLNLNQTL